MGRLDAVFLRDVVKYRRGAKLPVVPDWGYIQRQFDNIIKDIDYENYENAIDQLKSLKSELDLDSDLSDYVERSSEVIQTMHDDWKDSFSTLKRWEDPDDMSRKAMVDLIDTLDKDIYRQIPDTFQLREMANNGWFHFSTNKFILGTYLLGTVRMQYKEDDTYHGELVMASHGKMTIVASGDGVLRLQLVHTGDTMVFTHDEKIHTSTGAGDGFTMPMSRFKEFFETWYNPTQEEKDLFAVVHPSNITWALFEYFKEYERQKMIVSTAYVPVTKALQGQ